MNYKSEPFFQVPQQRVSVSAGDVDLPILYYDASAVYGFFLVDTQRATPLLEGTGLVTSMRIGSKSLAGIACYEYRNTTVGVYNEVGLALAVAKQGEETKLGGWPDVISSFTTPEERHIGMYILDLPVTTAQANAAGREIWGYPKFITDIPFRLKEREFFCAVNDPETHTPLMKLEGTMSPSVPVLPFSLTLFSHLKGKLIRATVNARGATRLALPGNVRLTLGDSAHPMAEHLRTLGLEGAKPLALMRTDCFQSRLNGGVIVEQ